MLARDINQTFESVSEFDNLVTEIGQRVALLSSTQSLLCEAVSEISSGRKELVDSPSPMSGSMFVEQNKRYIEV